MSKKETIEEAAERLYPIILEDGWDKNKQYRDEWIKGVKYQAERSYSEEDMIAFGKFCHNDAYSVNKVKTFKELFEQFKKKQS